ncbi:hypothetical protein ABIB40_000323 [Pedobacter sp. UYP30]|uniref:DUF547 domain-containing protein n=1 Tax=Pedobacter sp. UYP30 TaxID=1756400 RepID=UPI0033924D9C
MRGIYLSALCLIVISISAFSQEKTSDSTLQNPVKTSQDFLYAARTGDSTAQYITTLKNLDEDMLAADLDTDAKKIAFWLNIYNGFTQVILSKNPDQYKTRGAFFSSKQIEIASSLMSLDFIEHGILRHSKVKWAEGYLGKLFPSKLEKKYRVKKLDYRIHFALNCGAKSCPPIAFYEPNNLNSQLNVAVKTYLNGECEYDKSTNTVKVPALMGWFRGDFGGKSGIRKILAKNEIIPQGTKPKITFKTYDWTLYLNNYK